MKLKMLREHYYSNDNGANWILKQVFKSQEDIIAQGYDAIRWNNYTCSFCGFLHIAVQDKWGEDVQNVE